jgi:AAA domain
MRVITADTSNLAYELPVTPNKETSMKMGTIPPKSKTSPNKDMANDEECHIQAMDSSAFNQATFPREWLINRILVLDQPGVIGGPKKTLKTSLLVDMAVSIGTGTPFLGRFPVPKRRRVVVFSGESDKATLQDTARRVCEARDVYLDKCLVHWSFKLPRLNHKGNRLALRRFLRENRIKVAFLDPLYLCLLNGSRSVSASNLYEIGPLLWQAAQACLDAGATPFFVHHATKTAARRTYGSSEPMDLDDLAFAGIGEFARQWVLLSRREIFQPHIGRHRLLLSTGGSAGHSGCYDVTVDEGVLSDDFAGRKWEVQVRESGEDHMPRGMKQPKKRNSTPSESACFG